MGDGGWVLDNPSFKPGCRMDKPPRYVSESLEFHGNDRLTPTCPASTTRTTIDIAPVLLLSLAQTLKSEVPSKKKKNPTTTKTKMVKPYKRFQS